MDWMTAVVQGIGTYFGARGKDKERDAMNEDTFKWTSRLHAFDMELEDYFKQRDKAEMRRGANEYAKFSSLDRWAPEYRNTFVANPVPEKPTTDSIKDNY